MNYRAIKWNGLFAASCLALLAISLDILEKPFNLSGWSKTIASTIFVVSLYEVILWMLVDAIGLNNGLGMLD